MRFSDISNSDYLKASDLLGHTVDVTISHVELIEIGRPPKPKYVLYFAGKKKGLVLNKINGNVIVNAYGDDMDKWIGVKLNLFEKQVEFEGSYVPAIRLSIAGTDGNGATTERQKPAPQYQRASVTHDPMRDIKSGPPTEPVAHEERFDDGIPF